MVGGRTVWIVKEAVGPKRKPDPDAVDAATIMWPLK
jgi:hypothetical protein